MQVMQANDYFRLADSQIVALAELCALLNASIPRGAESPSADYVRIVDEPEPAALPGHRLERAAPQMMDGVCRRGWVQVLRPLAEQQSELRARNAARRDALLQAGVTYTFPDAPGTAQTRDARDLSNLNGIATTALLRAQTGVTDAVIPFRDQENATHWLTPTQALAFCDAVGQAVALAYQRKWTADEQIAALASAEAAAAFDLEAAWTA